MLVQSAAAAKAAAAADVDPLDGAPVLRSITVAARIPCKRKERDNAGVFLSNAHSIDKLTLEWVLKDGQSVAEQADNPCYALASAEGGDPGRPATDTCSTIRNIAGACELVRCVCCPPE